MRTALTIAGSDSGGGAGIQADLKTFAAHRVFGTSAITAITAQNTLGVTMWQACRPTSSRAQIEAVAGDIGADAVKVGMLANAAIVEAVAAAIADTRPAACRGRSGDGGERRGPAARGGRGRGASGRAAAARAYRHAQRARSRGAGGHRDRARSTTCGRPGERILALGPRVVLVKGGHLRRAGVRGHRGAPHDGTFELRARASPRRNTHGTGCTLSSAIAANLALGSTTATALTRAREYLDGAIRHAPGIGRGHGPLGHFWRLY